MEEVAAGHQPEAVIRSEVVLFPTLGRVQYCWWLSSGLQQQSVHNRVAIKVQNIVLSLKRTDQSVRSPKTPTGKTAHFLDASQSLCEPIQ